MIVLCRRTPTSLFLKGLYIEWKKKTNEGIDFPNLSNVTPTCTCTSQIRKSEFVSYGRPDERGRLSKHPNTEIFVGGRDVDEDIWGDYYGKTSAIRHISFWMWPFLIDRVDLIVVDRKGVRQAKISNVCSVFSASYAKVPRLQSLIMQHL